jgi:hypothetical protein
MDEEKLKGVLSIEDALCAVDSIESFLGGALSRGEEAYFAIVRIVLRRAALSLTATAAAIDSGGVSHPAAKTLREAIGLLVPHVDELRNAFQGGVVPEKPVPGPTPNPPVPDDLGETVRKVERGEG